MEDFVPFGLAVKLEGKGFSWNCVSFYPLESFTGEYVDSCGDCYEVDFEKDELYLNYPLHYKKHEAKCLPAPTTSQVLKWLRKEKGIYISIFVDDDSDTPVTYEIHKDSECVCTHQGEYFALKDWSKCELRAIEYVLDNLI